METTGRQPCQNADRRESLATSELVRQEDWIGLQGGYFRSTNQILNITRREVKNCGVVVQQGCYSDDNSL
jgi:hypothetical protein